MSSSGIAHARRHRAVSAVGHSKTLSSMIIRTSFTDELPAQTRDRIEDRHRCSDKAMIVIKSRVVVKTIGFAASLVLALETQVVDVKSEVHEAPLGVQ